MKSGPNYDEQKILKGYEVEVLKEGINMTVKRLLENAVSYNGWSLQGLGMLRYYLSPELRLHVWDNRFAFDGASPMHTHPWDFVSYVVAGRLGNVRYLEYDEASYRRGEGAAQRPWKKALLKCGEGGCLMENVETVYLEEQRMESYEPGQTYFQKADEIHHTMPSDGTVTLVRRKFTKVDRDHAYVFWRPNEEWGSAEPRQASRDEVQEITRNALDRFFA